MNVGVHSLVSSLSYGTRCFATEGGPQIGLRPGRETRQWLQSLRQLARRQGSPEKGQQVYAGLILERYPVCLPAVDQWKSEFQQWQQDWNAWKYKAAKPGWLDCARPTTDEADSVHTLWPAYAIECGNSAAHIWLPDFCSIDV